MQNGIVVSAEERLARLNGRCSGNDAGNADLAEYMANVDYRLCLSELGLTEEDLMEGE